MNYILRGAAVADARSPTLRLDQAVLVAERRVLWMGSDPEAEVPPGTREIDASGATIVPSLVDSHSHITLPGGAHWISHIADSPAQLLETAERNARRLLAGGVRWARDVGAPRRFDPDAGAERALSLGVRDRWAHRSDRPYIRAAGTWISRRGTLEGMVEVDDGDGLVAAVEQQAADGADLIKLYLDGPDKETAPFTSGEVSRAVAAAAAAGLKVTAHATTLHGARSAVEGGVASVEHGVHIDDELAADMAERGTYLVTTHSVWRSWEGFGHTTSIDRFSDTKTITTRREDAYESTRTAHRAGVPIAGGSDFGGGSVRAGQLAWEVESLVECGLEPWEALAAVTWRGGDLLGESGAGRLEVGGPADLFAVHGDPLTDPGALWRIWFAG